MSKALWVQEKSRRSKHLLFPTFVQQYLLSTYSVSGTRHTVMNKTDKIVSLIKLGKADNKQIHNMWIILNKKKIL